jgi:hypothetical protein
MTDREPLRSSDDREETNGEGTLTLLAARLMREPEVVRWLGADPSPPPWPDDDAPRAA